MSHKRTIELLIMAIVWFIVGNILMNENHGYVIIILSVQYYSGEQFMIFIIKIKNKAMIGQVQNVYNNHFLFAIKKDI